MNKLKKLFQNLLDSLTETYEGPNVERIQQPEDPKLSRKRFFAQEYLRTKSPKWRDRRIQHAPPDFDRTHQGAIK